MTTITVMLVDDEPINNMLHKKLLHHVNPQMNVLDFINPQDAVEYLMLDKRPIPDILFLDIYMPQMYAWEFLDVFPPGMNLPKIYLCTGSEDHRDESTALRYPMVRGFVRKPFDKETIERILKNEIISKP